MSVKSISECFTGFKKWYDFSNKTFGKSNYMSILNKKNNFLWQTYFFKVLKSPIKSPIDFPILKFEMHLLSVNINYVHMFNKNNKFSLQYFHEWIKSQNINTNLIFKC